jgi:hypothetical protein
MQGSSNQGYTKPACASTEICSAPVTACQSTTELLAAHEYLPARKVYRNTRNDRPWSVFLDDATPAEFPSDKPQQPRCVFCFQLHPTELQSGRIFTATTRLKPVPVAAWRRGSAAARLLRLWVQIPPGAWMSVVSVVCCHVEVSKKS